MSIDFRIDGGIIIFDEGGCRSASQAEIALWARVAELESQMEFVEKVADDNEDALRRRIAELEREVAWLREYVPSCWHASDAEGKRAVHVTSADEMHEHLASSPPEGWRPEDADGRSERKP